MSVERSFPGNAFGLRMTVPFLERVVTSVTSALSYVEKSRRNVRCLLFICLRLILPESADDEALADRIVRAISTHDRRVAI